MSIVILVSSNKISVMQKSKKDKKKYSGFPGDCSEEQLVVLDKFRHFVTASNQGYLDPQWDDTYLLRFLRARKFTMKDVQKMWADFINWRKKNEVDILPTHFHFPQLSHLRKLYPHGYHRCDKKYRPIYIERVGKTHPEDIFKLTNQHTLLQYYAMSYETLLTKIFDACTKQKELETGDGSRVTQTCTILDLKDIKLSNSGPAYRFAKPASEMTQNNYPEILGNMFVINAPFLFTGVWAVVKMWIDEKTKEKIQIFGSNYKKELLKHIDPENLPDFIDGGKCKCKGGDCLSLNIGPWNPEGGEMFPHCFEKKKEVPVKEKEKEEKKEQKKEEKEEKEEKREKREKREKKEEKEEEKEEDVMLLKSEGVIIEDDVLKHGLEESTKVESGEFDNKVEQS